MERTKVCIITEESIPPMQRFSVAMRLAETLGAEHEVHFIAVKSDGIYIPKNVVFHPVEAKGWDLFSLRQRVRTNLKLTFKAWKVCRENDIDLIYGWWPVAFFASRLSGKAYAADMPEFIDVMYRSFKKPFAGLMQHPLRFLQNMVARNSKAVITESPSAIDVWANRKVRRERLFTIPYGVETDFLKVQEGEKVEDLRSRYGIPQDKIMVMFHGDIGFDDGVDILIEAVKGLDIWCLIVGDGPARYIRHLKRTADKKTIFTGWVHYSQIPGYLASCDIYAAPFRGTDYTNSTFPLKQMESMAAGKPTICSRIAAFSRVVRDGYDIKLVTPGEIEGLRRALKELALDAELRGRLGNNAYKTAKEKFDWKIRVKKEIDILNGIIEELPG